MSNTKDTKENDKKLARVYILYTGGTIGMAPKDQKTHPVR